MIVTAQQLTMGTTKPPAPVTGNKVGEGVTAQVVTPAAPATTAPTFGQNLGAWFGAEGKDLGSGVFDAVGDRVGSAIRYGGASSGLPAADGGVLAADRASMGTSPLVIGGLVLAGLALVIVVLKK